MYGTTPLRRKSDNNFIAFRNKKNQPLSSHHFEMGEVLGSGAPFELSEDQLSTHTCVLGTTGSGKSKFIELLMRYLTVASARFFLLIDPHGDLSEDMLAYAAYLKVSKKDPESPPAFIIWSRASNAPLHSTPFGSGLRLPRPWLFDNAYSSWLRAKADRVAEIFQRKQNQATSKACRDCGATDAPIASGENANGEPSEHSPWATQCFRLFRQRASRENLQSHPTHLEPEIAADFDRIIACRNDDQRLRETESTINRLRSLFSPIM